MRQRWLSFLVVGVWFSVLNALGTTYTTDGSLADVNTKIAAAYADFPPGSFSSPNSRSNLVPAFRIYVQ